MAPKHNNALPTAHFHKDWQRRVKTWFNQAGKKKSRRDARAAKAAKIAPRPLDSLRPAVHCPTIKYNTKVRLGRGFTLEELKAAGIRKKEARSIGVTVDHRRRNRSEESLALNVQRLKEYKARLIVFPRKASKPKHGDATKDAIKAALEAGPVTGTVLPLVKDTVYEEPARAITAEEKATSAFDALCKARNDAKMRGIRIVQAKKKAEEEANKVKKA
ncbi:ribosomal protein L13e [Ramicandelaber brevisporus]|nr:ribosomal protein L13e [Ramicandelaber brevisporus]